MFYLLSLVDDGRRERTRLFKVQGPSVRAVEVAAHRAAAQHRQADPHDCRLNTYVIVIFDGPNHLPRIVATGGIHHGDWPTDAL